MAIPPAFKAYEYFSEMMHREDYIEAQDKEIERLKTIIKTIVCCGSADGICDGCALACHRINCPARMLLNEI